MGLMITEIQKPGVCRQARCTEVSCTKISGSVNYMEVSVSPPELTCN